MFSDLQLVPEFDANAQVTSVLCVARDITRRKQNEELLPPQLENTDGFA